MIYHLKLQIKYDHPLNNNLHFLETVWFTIQNIQNYENTIPDFCQKLEKTLSKIIWSINQFINTINNKLAKCKVFWLNNQVTN